MAGLVIAVSSVFGLLVGSFLNVVIARVPAGLSVVSPRSRCPGCETELANRDNVPVLSWILLRGRCRTCEMRISPRYPMVELLTALLFGAVAARLGLDWALPAFLVWTAGLLALSVIDLDTFLLPRKVLYPVLFATAALLGVAALVTRDARGAAEAAAGGLLAFALLFVIHFISPKGMGFGDVRLAGLIGMVLGWIELPLVGVGLFLSFLFASVVGIGLMLLKRRGRKDRIPFGPYLAMGGFTAVLLGQSILEVYLGR